MRVEPFGCQTSPFLRPPAHFLLETRLVCQGGAPGFILFLHSGLIFSDMGEHNKILSRPIFHRDVSWDPFPNWTQPSRFVAQDLGLPPFLEPSDLDWIDWAKRRLGSFSWPGYAQSPLLLPFMGQHPAALNQKGPGEPTNGVSEIRTGLDSWKINLDVNHFSPEEVTITTKDGYLLISGKMHVVCKL